MEGRVALLWNFILRGLYSCIDLNREPPSRQEETMLRKVVLQNGGLLRQCNGICPIAPFKLEMGCHFCWNQNYCLLLLFGTAIPLIPLRPLIHLRSCCTHGRSRYCGPPKQVNTYAKGGLLSSSPRPPASSNFFVLQGEVTELFNNNGKLQNGAGMTSPPPLVFSTEELTVVSNGAIHILSSCTVEYVVSKVDDLVNWARRCGLVPPADMCWPLVVATAMFSRASFLTHFLPRQTEDRCGR
jgi:hypothetical protein